MLKLNMYIMSEQIIQSYKNISDPLLNLKLIQKPERQWIVLWHWWNVWNAFWVKCVSVRDAVLVLNSAGFIKAAVELGPSPEAKTNFTSLIRGNMSISISFVHSFIHSSIYLIPCMYLSACTSFFRLLGQSFHHLHIHSFIHTFIYLHFFIYNTSNSSIHTFSSLVQDYSSIHTFIHL